MSESAPGLFGPADTVLDEIRIRHLDTPRPVFPFFKRRPRNSNPPGKATDSMAGQACGESGAQVFCARKRPTGSDDPVGAISHHKPTFMNSAGLDLPEGVTGHDAGITPFSATFDYHGESLGED